MMIAFGLMDAELAHEPLVRDPLQEVVRDRRDEDLGLRDLGMDQRLALGDVAVLDPDAALGRGLAKHDRVEVDDLDVVAAARGSFLARARR